VVRADAATPPATIVTVYGQTFTGAGAGQFGAAAQNMSASMKSGFGGMNRAAIQVSSDVHSL
jgi:hypothetical protein